MPPPDRRDDKPPRRSRRPSDEEEDEDEDVRDNDGGVSTLIPYRNGLALASYYTGVFSLIPCVGLVLGPTAIVLGILGLRYANRNPKAKGTAHAVIGLVLGGLTALGNWGVVIVGVIGILLGGK